MYSHLQWNTTRPLSSLSIKSVWAFMFALIFSLFKNCAFNEVRGYRMLTDVGLAGLQVSFVRRLSFL